MHRDGCTAGEEKPEGVGETRWDQQGRERPGGVGTKTGSKRLSPPARLRRSPRMESGQALAVFADPAQG